MGPVWMTTPNEDGDLEFYMWYMWYMWYMRV